MNSWCALSHHSTTKLSSRIPDGKSMTCYRLFTNGAVRIVPEVWDHAPAREGERPLLRGFKNSAVLLSLSLPRWGTSAAPASLSPDWPGHIQRGSSLPFRRAWRAASRPGTSKIGFLAGRSWLVLDASSFLFTLRPAFAGFRCVANSEAGAFLFLAIEESVSASTFLI